MKNENSNVSQNQEQDPIEMTAAEGGVAVGAVKVNGEVAGTKVKPSENQVGPAPKTDNVQPKAVTAKATPKAKVEAKPENVEPHNAAKYMSPEIKRHYDCGNP